MPGGHFFGTLFFVLLVFAAWTSAISLIEPAVAYMVENRGLKRGTSAVLVGALGWVLGLVTVMSFSDWSFRFNFAGATKTDGMFDVLDILTSTFMLPLGGLAIAIFAGWIMQRKDTVDELAMGEHFGYRLWYLLVRYISPLAVVIMFLHTLGVF
jgi:NSS family neurotransmitter:Na+ symporter